MSLSMIAAQSKGKASKQVNGHQHRTSWREVSLSDSTPMLRLVKEAATTAPCAELKGAASLALAILQTIQAIKENKEAYEGLGEDSGRLAVAICGSYRKAELPKELSTEMRNILKESKDTLEDIHSFLQEYKSKNKMHRMLSRKNTNVKINGYREDLGYHAQTFELQSKMDLNKVPIQLGLKMNHQPSEDIDEEDEDLKRALEESAREARDRAKMEKIQEELEKLKEISIFEARNQEEKETKDRQLELERLRARASTMEIAMHSKTVEEEEIAHLRRKIAQIEGQRGTKIQARSTKNMSSRLQEDAEEAEEWREEETSEEEEEAVKRNAKVKGLSESPNRQSVLEDSTDYDEDLQSFRGSKTRRERLKLSSTSLRIDDESVDKEENYVPGKRPKFKRKRQRSSSSPPRAMEDSKLGAKSFRRSSEPHGTRSKPQLGSPMYTPNIRSNPHFPLYEVPRSLGLGAYEYAVGLPLRTTVNLGMGNITNSTISNVGNNNSVTVRKVYHN